MKPYFLFIILLSLYTGLFAETAILPYEIVNPSKNLNEKSGREYARILYLAARLHKKIILTSPDSIDIDIERMKFGRVITKDEMELLGRTRHVDYVLAGSLAKTGLEYQSRSRLYSVHDRKIIVDSTVSASNLFSLAEKEIREVFATFEKNEISSTSHAMDLVFLIDCSYSLKNDWPAIKSGILALTRKFSDSMSMDTLVYGIPFSNTLGTEKIFMAQNSLFNVQKGLDELNPMGKSGNKYIEGALKYAIRNVQWRNQSGKAIIIISNVNYENSIDLESYSFGASKRGILIFSILGGNISDKTLDTMRSMSATAGGDSFALTYHRDFINARGEKGHLFLERGRLFFSNFSRPDWRQGIIKKDRQNPSFEKADEIYTEVININKHAFVKPETMAQVYQSGGGDPVLKEGVLENSAEDVFGFIPAYFQKKHTAKNRPMARVLVSDGSASVWLTVYDKALMEYLALPEREKYYFSLGLSLHDDSKETYGVKFVPRLYDIRQTDIPESLTVQLGSLLSHKKQYMDAGLSMPPVWFVNVRVERVHGANKRRDVRLP